MKKRRNLKQARRLLELKRARTPMIFKPVVGFQLVLIILMTMVLTRRVRVANRLYGLSDGDLYAKGTGFVTAINTNSTIFSTPLPALATISSSLSDFLTSINEALNGGTTAVTTKNTKREVVMNLLCALGNYVEDVANDPANADPGPTAVIESAGMRAQVFNPRGKQMWDVFRGFLSGTLILTAESVDRGFHQWQYTTTPTVDTSWIDIPSTTRAKTSISGLTPATFVYCRHRVITKSGTSDWEGHDPVIIV